MRIALSKYKVDTKSPEQQRELVSKRSTVRKGLTQLRTFKSNARVTSQVVVALKEARNSRKISY